MVEDKDIQIQVQSYCDGHMIEVLNADGDRTLFGKGWGHSDYEIGDGGEKNFVDLLKFLRYTVHHEEVF